MKPVANGTRTIVLAVLVVCCFLFSSPVFSGEYDRIIPKAARGRVLYPELNTRFELDDNVNTREENKQFTQTYFIRPKMTLALLKPVWVLLARYQFGFIYYEDLEDDVVITHRASLVANRRLSSLQELKLSESFRRVTEPEESIVLVDEEGEVLTDDLGQQRTIITKRNLTYDSNKFSADFNQLFSQRLSSSLSFSSNYWDYEDSETQNSANLTSNTYGLSVSYTLSFNPRKGQSYPNSISFGYRFTDNDYRFIERDSESEVYYAQYVYWSGPRLRLSLVGGLEQREFDTGATIASRHQEEPYAVISLISYLSPSFTGTVNYSYRISETKEELFTSRISQMVSFGLTQKVSPKSTIMINGAFDLGTYKVDQAAVEKREDLIEEFRHDFDQNILQFSIEFKRKINDRITLETGWRFTEIDSEIPNNNYTRNRYYFGINALL